MSRLIRENDVYALFALNGMAHLHVGHIDVLPRVEVKEVIHAYWFAPCDGYQWRCSHCRRKGGRVKSSYCPHCGAQMDEEVNK